MSLLEAKWSVLERWQQDKETQAMAMGGGEWQKGCPDGGDGAGNGSLPASSCLLSKCI